MKTITRVSITEAIYEEIGLSRKDAGDLLDMVIEEIRSELVSGKEVKMCGTILCLLQFNHQILVT